MHMVLLREDYMQTLRILVSEEIKTSDEMLCFVGETDGILTSIRRDDSASRKLVDI